MRAGIHVICRRETGLGVGLAGVAPITAATGGEAATALDALAREPARGGVVLIEQALYDALLPGTRRQLRREGLPIVMPFPGPQRVSGAAPEQELLEILRRAIGYRVRLR